MKKKIILILLLAVLIIIVSILLLVINHINEMKRYKQIKEDVKREAETYLEITKPIIYNPNKKEWLYEEDIVSPLHRGANKNIILDVDKKNYCKVAIRGYVQDNKWNAKVYLKCKNYEDELYEYTLVNYMCVHWVPEGYEEYYKKYGMNHDNFNCPKEMNWY